MSVVRTTPNRCQRLADVMTASGSKTMRPKRLARFIIPAED